MTARLTEAVLAGGSVFLAGTAREGAAADIPNGPWWDDYDPAKTVEPVAAPDEPAAPKPTKAEMLAEIERRNEGRDDDAKIVPASQKNADLQAALAADDAAAEASEDEGDGDDETDEKPE